MAPWDFAPVNVVFLGPGIDILPKPKTFLGSLNVPKGNLLAWLENGFS